MKKRQRAILWTNTNRRFESRYFKKINSTLGNVKLSVIALIRQFGLQGAVTKLNNDLLINGIAEDIRSLYIDVGTFHAKRTSRELLSEERKELPGIGYYETWTQFILEQLNRFLRDKILFKASETTKSLLLSIISKGIEEGWSIDRMVDELNDYPGLRYQAERIVRTEVNRAANIGIVAAGKLFKFEQQKEWISILDIRTRGTNPEDHANHRSLHGQRVDFESPFTDPSNKDLLMQPGDPTANAESTINCRCTMALVAKRDEHGRLIPIRGRQPIQHENIL